MKKINGKAGLLRLIACLLVCFFNNNVPKQLSSKPQQQQVQRPLVAPGPQVVPISKEDLAKKKGLLIFLDDSERDELGSISYKLLTALYQEASPIIASTSLLYTLLEYSKQDSRLEDALLDEVEKEEREIFYKPMDSASRKNKEESNRKNQQIIVSKVGFKPDRWIIKEINNLLSLLIPINYLESLNITKDKVKKTDYASEVITDVELQLGFKVNHMETLDYKGMRRPIHRRFLNYFFSSPRFANYFTYALNAIFCEKSDYKERKIDIPEWFIYINGHGLVNYSIAHLSLDDFKQVLTFLDNKLNTKLLVVSTCYVAGTNTDAMYGDIKLRTQQYYSFPIIVQGLNDVTTFGTYINAYRSSSYVLEPDKEIEVIKKEIQLSSQVDFAHFLNNAKETKSNYSEVVKPISIDFIENTPQIKLPGLEWFSVLDADNKIVSIGSILAKTRDPQKPLDVVTFFKKDPEIILLYTDDIPFELKIDSYNLRAIVSMVSAGLKENDWVRTAYGMNTLPSTANFLIKVDRWLLAKAKIMAAAVSSKLKLADSVRVIHRIKKISSTTHYFFSIAYWFKTVASSGGLKWFFIDEIQDSNNQIFKDVLMLGTHEEGMRVYYKDKDNVLFVRMLKDSSEDKKVESGSEHEKFYQERMHLIREQYPQLSAAAKEARQEISSEQIKKIENVLIKQRERQIYEAQK